MMQVDDGLLESLTGHTDQVIGSLLNHLLKEERSKAVIFTDNKADTQLPQSRVGGQGLYLRSLYHLGRSSEAKDRKKQKKCCVTDGPID